MSYLMPSWRFATGKELDMGSPFDWFEHFWLIESLTNNIKPHQTTLNCSEISPLLLQARANAAR